VRSISANQSGDALHSFLLKVRKREGRRCVFAPFSTAGKFERLLYAKFSIVLAKTVIFFNYRFAKNVFGWKAFDGMNNFFQSLWNLAKAINMR